MNGQVSMEFMVIIVVMLSTVLVFFLASYSKESSIRSDEIQRKLNSVCNDIATKIDKAVSFGNGFTQNITLPAKIYDLNYSVYAVNNETLYCSAGNYNTFANLISGGLNNTTSYAPFYIPIREIKINNTQGVIVIT